LKTLSAAKLNDIRLYFGKKKCHSFPVSQFPSFSAFQFLSFYFGKIICGLFFLFLFAFFFHVVTAAWTKLVIEHKTPAIATFGTLDVERLTTIHAEVFVSAGCFSTFGTFECTHFILRFLLI